MKQSKIDRFIGLKNKVDRGNKKGNKNVRDKHESSLEGSQGTVRLDDSIEEIPLEVFESHRLVCPSFVLLSPSIMVYYPKVERQLRSLCDSYSKQKAKDFILSNLQYQKINNLRNLNQIDDEQFWDIDLPAILELTFLNIRDIENTIRVLPQGMQEIIVLTRLQCFVILSCMFLGILPKQMHEELVHLGELMTIRDGEAFPAKLLTRREKLKCILAYFKHMVRNNTLHREIIQIQRAKNTNTDFMDYMKMDRETPLKMVKVELIDDQAIEDYCGTGIMIDFANKRLGGGVLRNGCVQEEVLFSIFPEAIVSKVICQQMDDNEAVIIYGARRYSSYDGYSDNFQYVPFKRLDKVEIAEKSILVAIDATDFSMWQAKNYQYSKKSLRREINKAVTGFQGADLNAEEYMPIITGRWGCGAFQGDEELKFLIQWVAASECDRDMIYITNNRQKVKEYTILVRQLQTLCVLDIIGIMDEYYRCRTTMTNSNPISILNYIKNYAR